MVQLRTTYLMQLMVALNNKISKNKPLGKTYTFIAKNKVQHFSLFYVYIDMI